MLDIYFSSHMEFITFQKWNNKDACYNSNQEILDKYFICGIYKKEERKHVVEIRVKPVDELEK